MKTFFRMVVLIVALLVTPFVPVCVARAAEGNRSALALDVVIVLDQSKSMYDEKDVQKSNDRYGYRLEAAGIMLSLCDTRSSRAAIVPFNDNVLSNDSYYCKLMDISMTGNNDNRSSMIRHLLGINKDTARNTNIGAALEKAVDLLTGPGSANVGNRPVILLLTDGDIDIRNANSSLPNAKLEAESKQQMEDATARARDAGIVIHTIALTGTTNYDTSDLARIAKDTGGCFRNIHSAGDLPTTFNALFAKEIGSDVITLSTTTEETADGGYRVDLNIPNRSVTEANIMLGTNGMQKTGNIAVITLRDPDGNEVSPDGVSVIRSDTNYFVLYKIVKPEKTGLWTLNFTRDEQETQAADSTINVVFSYAVDLKADVTREVVNKDDEISFEAYFTQDGVPAADSDLYRTADEKHPETIRASYSIQSGSREYGSGDMDTVVGQKFTKTLSLKEIGIRHEGVYTVKVHTEGNGLVRDTEKQFQVKNQAPRGSNNGAEIKIDVDDPLESSHPAVSAPAIDVSNLFVDDDGSCDTLSYRFASDFDSSLIGVKLNGSLLSVSTRNGMFSDGETDKSTEIRVICQDNDETTAERTIPVTVHSLRNAFVNDYKLVVSTPDRAVKGAGCRMLLQWQRTDGTDANAPDSVYGNASAELNYRFNDIEKPTLVFEKGADDEGRTALVATLPLTDYEGVYTFAMGTCDYGDESETFTLPDVTVTNVAPEKKPGAVPFAASRAPEEPDADMNVYVSPFFLLRWLGLERGEPTEQLTANLADLFVDPDDDAQSLNYIVTCQLEGDAASAILLESVNGAVTLSPVAMDKSTFRSRSVWPSTAYTLVFQAIDDENAISEPYTMRLIIANDTVRGLRLLVYIALGAIAGLFLAKGLIWLCKPRYARGMEIQSQCDGFINGSPNEKPLPMSKKPYPLLSYVDPADATTCNVTNETLEAVFIAPRGKGSIKVYVDKKKVDHLFGIALTLDGKPIHYNGKKYPWAVDASLTLRVGDQGTPLRLTLVCHNGMSGDDQDPVYRSPEGTEF